MRFLVEHLWPALATAFALGLGVGTLGVAERPMSRSGRARTILAAFALAAAGGTALLQLVPGQAGLWLDGGVLLALAYSIACGVGLLGRRLVRRHDPAQTDAPAA